MPDPTGQLARAEESISGLVDRYSRNRDHYRASTYNEETCRAEFITPFFEALGWDVTNRGGLAEGYKDVIHEEGIRVGDQVKAPDYTFRIGGTRKFFVEAKKPFVDLQNDPAPAYQLRRYAWTAGLPLSILTDFEELAVYDTRIPPKQGDRTSVARILYLRFDEFLPRLEDLWRIFSKDAVLKGAFDLYADSTLGKRGTSPVDAEFLREIEGWRVSLARNLALRNPDLSVEELNFAVQVVIDRVIFFRIAEGRGVEPYAGLQALTDGTGIYSRLTELCQRADTRYNSGLFDFSSDRLTPTLVVDDKVLKPILAGLYYPQSPYEFSVLPPEILGKVYEQFLGKVIRLTAGHRAVVDEKPEVKKAGGVYYTPGFIVDYIVAQTVGAMCEGKSPRQLEKLRVLDPSCGSGSFLLRAYQELLDRHLSWYVDHDPDRFRGEVYQGAGGAYRLTTKEKRRILLNGIYGVDIDRQAVEVTKLSLLLKVLEDESEETVRQQVLFGERALPSLERNIKCGNSLIDPRDVDDYLLDPSERRRINPFPWESEFSVIVRDGGFDAVIGNPPYIRIQTMQEWAPREVELYKTLFRSARSGNYDIYVAFVEKALSLLRLGGRLGFILPHKFFNAKYGGGLRYLIAEGGHLSGIVHFKDQQVFEGATTYTCLLFLQHSARKQAVPVCYVSDLAAWRADKVAGATIGSVPIARVTASDWVFVAGRGAELLDRLRSFPKKLADVTDRIYQGLKTGADKVYIVEERERTQDGSRVFSSQTGRDHWIELGLLHPLIKGGDSRPYVLAVTTRQILFPYAMTADGTASLIPATDIQRHYPRTWEYLSENRTALEGRDRGRLRGLGWFGFSRTQALEIIRRPKIFTPDLASRASFSLDETGEVYFTGGVAGGYGIIVPDGHDPLFLLGLLNSRLLDWYLRQTTTQMRGGFFSYEARFIRGLPIVWPERDDPTLRRAQEQIVVHARRMLVLAREFVAATTPPERTAVERELISTESLIDREVYGLYGVSPDEIEMVSAETPRKSMRDLLAT